MYGGKPGLSVFCVLVHWLGAFLLLFALSSSNPNTIPLSLTTSTQITSFQLSLTNSTDVIHRGEPM